MKINALKEIAQFVKKEAGQKCPIKPNTLEYSPAKEVLEKTLNKVQSEVSPAKIKMARTARELAVQFDAKLADVKEGKFLTEELLHFLNPKIDAFGNKTFTSGQMKVIDAALAKIKFFKVMSKELAQDAAKYGDEVLNEMKQVFGGDEGLGKYLVVRKKDDVSVYNKLVKEFKDDRIKSEVHNIFSKKLYGKRYSQLDKTDRELVKLCIEQGEVKLDSKDFKIIENAFRADPKDYYAMKKYGKSFVELDKEQKNTVKNIVFRLGEQVVSNSSIKQAKIEATNYIRDLVGIRLQLPTGSRAEMTQLEKYMDKAIGKGKLNISRISNYHANHILPYIKKEKTLIWKEMIPGMELVETAEVRKRNGYTTTQINLLQKIKGRTNPVLVEFQIRTEALNKIGQIEHLIYDILAKKNISKDIPQLKSYYETIGIENAVKKVFNDPKLEAKYTDYERAYYSFIRNKELGSPSKIGKPLLEEYGLGEYEHLLSFDALQQIDDKAILIKEKFGPKINAQKKKIKK